VVEGEQERGSSRIDACGSGEVSGRGHAVHGVEVVYSGVRVIGRRGHARDATGNKPRTTTYSAEDLRSYLKTLRKAQ
jgi:hypothetical protein